MIEAAQSIFGFRLRQNRFNTRQVKDAELRKLEQENDDLKKERQEILEILTRVCCI
jgi:chromosome segregation ATPase